MKLLVTGSQGMVGTMFMEAAKIAGHHVLGIDKKSGINLNEPDMVNAAIIKLMPDFDMVIHLAATCSTAKSLRSPVGDFADNAMATFQVAEICRIMQKPVIYTSSIKAEPNEKGMRTPYGMTKFLGEEIIKEYKHTFGVPYIINRPGTIYGKGQSASPESGWLSWFVRAAVWQEPLTIFGTGEQVRDILAVQDYVHLLMDQVENFSAYEGYTYDVGGGEANAISLLQALEYLGYKNYNFGKKRPGDADRYVSVNGVNEINGWQPVIGWKEGIDELVGYEKELLAQATNQPDEKVQKEEGPGGANTTGQ